MKYNYFLKKGFWLDNGDKMPGLSELLTMLPSTSDRHAAVLTAILVDQIMKRLTSELKKQVNPFGIVRPVNLKEGVVEVATFNFFYVKQPLIAPTFSKVVYISEFKQRTKGERMQFVIMIRGP